MSNLEKKFEAIKKEIKEKGWNGILETYHPDISMLPNGIRIFTLYRATYEYLVEKGEIKVD
jgi:hypothetical protein